VIPILVVIAGILKSSLAERRRASARPDGHGRDPRGTDDAPPGG
jgi:hypothetical protein